MYGRREVERVSAHFAASLTASVCLALTLVLNVAPFDPTLGNRRVHVGIEVAAAMVLLFIAAVLLGRFRLNGSRRTLLKFGAVVVLVLDNLLSAVMTASMDADRRRAVPDLGVRRRRPARCRPAGRRRAAARPHDPALPGRGRDRADRERDGGRRQRLSWRRCCATCSHPRSRRPRARASNCCC